MAVNNDFSAEFAVIGSMLRDESVVSGVLSVVDAADFADPTGLNRRLFEAARALFRAGEPVDPMTVLGKLGLDANAEARAYAARLMDETPTAANWREYAKLMHDAAVLRSVHAAADQLSGALTLEDCQKPAAALAAALSVKRGVRSRTLDELFTAFAERQSKPEAQKPRFETGFSVIDHKVKLTGGKFVAIGGLPSDGKTALALQLALRFAKDKSVGIFSLETDDETVGDRFVTSAMQIDYEKIIDRRLTDLDWVRFAEQLPRYCRRNLRVFDESRLRADQITALSAAYGFDAVFIDYGQIVETERVRGMTRAEQLAEVSIALKQFALATDTLVVVTLQRKPPERYKLKDGTVKTLAPTMEDIGDSRQWEKDADVLFMISRPDGGERISEEVADSPKLDYDKHRILKIAKNKEGQRGQCKLYFDGAHQTFYVLGSEPSAHRPGDRARKKDAGNPGQQFIPLSESEKGDMPF